MKNVKIGSMGALFNVLGSGKEFKASFECGGDETIVTFLLDGQYVDWQDPVAQELFEILVGQFDLPNAGEFFVNGEGLFSKQGMKLFMEYDFTESGYGWDPETDEEIVMEDEKRSGKEEVYDFTGAI